MAVLTLAEPGGLTCPAPPWYVDYVRLGMAVARCAADGGSGRTVVAVSAPTESLAATAIALGYCRQRFVTAPPQLEPAADLDSLAPGERIWFRAGEQVRTATFLRVNERAQMGTSNGWFRTDALKELRRIPPHLSALPDADVALTETVDGPFLRSFLRGSDPLTYATCWQAPIALVGSSARIAAELSLLIGGGDGSDGMGELQQLLRPLDRFWPAGFHCVTMSARADEAAWASWPNPPSVSILRGAYATSRWLPETSASTVISVLGRAEAGLDAALTALYQDRAYGTPISSGDLGWSAPDGCELLAYRTSA